MDSGGSKVPTEETKKKDRAKVTKATGEANNNDNESAERTRWENYMGELIRGCALATNTEALLVKHPNVQKEVKGGIRKLAEIMRRIMKQGQAMSYQTCKPPNRTNEMATQTEVADGRDETTQTVANESRRAGRKRRGVAEIRARLDPTADYESFVAIEEGIWPEEAFSRTKEMDGKFWQAAKGVAKAYGMDDPDALGEEVPAPEQELLPGTLVHYQVARKCQTGEEEQETDLFCLVTAAKGQRVPDRKAVYKALLTLKQEMVQLEIRRLAIPRIGRDHDTLQWWTLRKMIENIFTDTNMEIEMYGKTMRNKKKKAGGKTDKQGKGDDQRTDQMRKTARRGKGKEKEREEALAWKEEATKNKYRHDAVRNAVLVKGNGQSYADLVRKVKGLVDPETTGEILGMRKTRTGENLLLTVEKKEGAAEALRSIIHDKLDAGCSAHTLGGRASIQLRDIDAVTSKEEVLEALNRELGPGNREIRTMRPGPAETQTAVLVVSKKEGDLLLSKGRVRIGLIMSRVREWAVVQICYRCLGYGHIAANCKEKEAAGRACYRCGGENHIAKNCKGRIRCSICKQDGHRQGTGRCPAHRRALEEARSRQRSSR